jgi:HSP20 family protein
VEKKETEEDKGKNYLHKETREWSATRGVYLKDAATEGLTARLENGVLTVNVPKQVEKPNVTKISID